ncbi:hypothetical protein [Cupriavidus nantongensis]|uniref:hypothetical protein n=1 Tax=Cupriavidus nantongensis TaxID=1796606 RepID=UPI000AB7FFF3|nr:hypothetical protein [Cupriavidus nantongensis]
MNMRYIPTQDEQLGFDVEAFIRACVPGGPSCDPGLVADAIREWFDSFDDGPVSWPTD